MISDYEAKLVSECADLRAKLNAAEQRVKELEAALRKYGRHAEYCAAEETDAGCCCGLTEVLAVLKGEGGHRG